MWPSDDDDYYAPLVALLSTLRSLRLDYAAATTLGRALAPLGALRELRLYQCGNKADEDLADSFAAWASSLSSLTLLEMGFCMLVRTGASRGRGHALVEHGTAAAVICSSSCSLGPGLHAPTPLRAGFAMPRP